MQCSLLVPMVPAAPEDVAPIAAQVRYSSQLHRLWQGQTHGLDPVATFAYLAGAGYRVPVGLSVLITPLRHPYQAAVEARTLAAVTGLPTIVGFGCGSATMQAALLPVAYASPVDAVAEYLLAVRRALGQLTASDARDPRFGRDRYVRLDGTLPPLPTPPVQLAVGVLRPRMARLAGALADAAITWLAPARYLGEVIVPELRDAARAAGRCPPRVVSMVALALSGPGRDPVAQAHEAAGGHLDEPHYADMLGRAGVDVVSDDPARRAAALVHGRGFLFGSASEIADGLLEFAAAGVDEVVLDLTSTYRREGMAATAADLSAVLAALTARPSGRSHQV